MASAGALIRRVRAKNGRGIAHAIVEPSKLNSVEIREGTGTGFEGSSARGSGREESTSFVNFEALRRDEYLSSASLTPAKDGQGF